MTDNNTNPISEEQLTTFLNEFDQKINGYMLFLKKQSSEEILNGSAQKAQSLLNKIIQVEDGVKRVSYAHESFLKLLKGDKLNTNEKYERKVSFTESSTKISQAETEDIIEHNTEPDKPKGNFKYRMPLLKALIYLGGNAKEEDVLEFVHKEIKKKLSDEELSVNGDGKTKVWVRDLRTDSDNMVSEGLLSKDSDDNSYEITQNGIDYLAKNDD